MNRQNNKAAVEPLCLHPNDVTHVIYKGHQNIDSTVAAAIVNYYFNDKTDVSLEHNRYSKLIEGNKRGSVVFLPTVDHLPNITGDASTVNLLMLGAPYKLPILQNLIKKYNKVLIVDYHSHAINIFKDISSTNKLIYPNNSYCSLAWKFFFPNDDIPALVSAVEDYQLNKNYGADTDNLISYLNTITKPHNAKYQSEIINNLNEYAKYFDYGIFRGAIEKGKIYKELNTYYIDQLVTNSWMRFMKIGKNYYLTINASCNINNWKSDLADKILIKHPNANFSAVNSVRSNGTTDFLLKSNDNTNVDVLSIAKTFCEEAGGNSRQTEIRINNIAVYVPGTIIGNSEWSQYLNTLRFLRLSGLGGIYIVCFHTVNDKLEIGNYLLQTRNKDQNCVTIGFNEKVNNVPQRVDIAIVWNYDAIANKSFFKLIKSNNVPNDKWIYLLTELYQRDDMDSALSCFSGICNGILNLDNLLSNKIGNM